ncbi:flagellar assembly protein FliX [Sphingomonas sp. IC-11]|nr:flagellar assembly protein FliX [Sphingomonas sp. IC-11]
MLAILPKAEPGFRAALPQVDSPAPSSVAQPHPAAMPATSVQMLVQMAAADVSVERRRRIAESAGRGLALLQRLHAETLVPPAGVEAVRGLENWLETFEMPEDAELASLMQEIELRVRVELAKHEMHV